MTLFSVKKMTNIMDKMRSQEEMETDQIDCDDLGYTETEMLHPHPLLIDHIISGIFHCLCASSPNPTCSLKQMCQMRLVCRQWNRVATNVVRKRFQQIFGGIDHNIGKFKKYLDIVQPQNRESLSWAKLPFARFTFHANMFQTETFPNVIEFLEICGSDLESLVIHKDIYSDADYEEEKLSEICLPNLKQLDFHDQRRNNGSDAANQTLLFTLVRCANDSLQNLSLQAPRDQDILIRLLKENTLPRLTSLKLDVLITDEILNTLAGMQLRLKELHLSVGPSKFSATSLKNMLESVQYRVQVLKITDLLRSSKVTLAFPRLFQLRVLEIQGFELPAYQVSFPNFSYELLPNLQKLLLKTWAPTPSWEIFFPSLHCSCCASPSNQAPNITELSLPMNFDSVILTKRIPNAFPALKKLEMYFSRPLVPTIEIIFKELVQLEELKLNQSYVEEISTTCIDDVLTGLPAEECQQILKNRAFSTTDFTHLQTKCGLTNLKNLKRFDMIDLRHRNYVTDVTGYIVFPQMKSLRSLSVDPSQMSTKCLSKLSQAFPSTMMSDYLNHKKILARREKESISELSPCEIV